MWTRLTVLRFRAPGQQYDATAFDYSYQKGILYQSFGTMKGCPFTNPNFIKIAATHKCVYCLFLSGYTSDARIPPSRSVTVAQVCMRWVLQKGAVLAVGTGSSNATAKAYAREDLDVFGFNLTEAEMNVISRKTVPPPQACRCGRRVAKLTLLLLLGLQRRSHRPRHSRRFRRHPLRHPSHQTQSRLPLAVRPAQFLPC